MVNMVQLEKALTYIRDHPERHDQRSWISDCGTAACIAGWACMLNGWRVSPSYWRTEHVRRDIPSGQEVQHVRTAAMEIFDISDEDANLLFWGGNSLETLELMVKDLGNGELLEDRWYQLDEDDPYGEYIRKD